MTDEPQNDDPFKDAASLAWLMIMVGLVMLLVCDFLAAGSIEGKSVPPPTGFSWWNILLSGIALWGISVIGTKRRVLYYRMTKWGAILLAVSHLADPALMLVLGGGKWVGIQMAVMAGENPHGIPSLVAGTPQAVFDEFWELYNLHILPLILTALGVALLIGGWLARIFHEEEGENLVNPL